MKSKQEIERTLSGFSGTENYWKHGALKLTDGVNYLRNAAEAFWLIDIVDSLRFVKNAARGEFLSIKLIKNKTGSGAKFIADDGNGNIVYTQNIPYTDFPMDSIKMFFTNNVLMLANEY